MTLGPHSARVAVLVALLFSAPWPAQAQQPVSLETLRGWMAELSNAGRWGDTDELGTLNLVTPDKRREAAALVREGVSVSLAHDLVAGPNPNAIRPMEVEFTVTPPGTTTAALDEIRVLYHGWAYSHLDALSHFAFDGALYNGVGVDALSESGASRLGIDVMRDGIVTRGVLIDVPRLRGVDHLEPGELITSADIEEWEDVTGIRVSQGDVLLIRTGRWHREDTVGPWAVRRLAAGVHPSVAHWLRERGVAALGGDGVNDRNPSIVEGISDPLHQLTLVAMGMPLFDNLDLEALAEAASERSRWTFFFVAAPLRVPGGSGSPLNPLAVF